MTLISDIDMQRQLQQSLNGLQIKDQKSEIPLLPYHFAQQLRKNFIIESEITLSLATANTLGWIGYTIYDKVLDDEARISTLPFAQICVLHTHEILYSAVPRDHRNTISRILSSIATANAWEYEHCVLKNEGGVFLLPEYLPSYSHYMILAQKSLGHALGPIITCFLIEQSDQALIVEEFFTHYIIAKQLNDDAHDWLDDLHAGKLNSISTMLIKQWQESFQDENSKRINLETDMPLLQEWFWEKCIDTVSSAILHHIDIAKTELQKITVLQSVTFLEELLIPLEQAALQAVNDRDRTKRFLQAVSH